MRRRVEVVFGQAGQSLYWDAPEGRPSSVTSVSVYRSSAGDDTAGEPATSGSASVDSVNTTVDAASGYGQADARRVNVASTAGIATGREYLLTAAADGAREWVEAVEIAPGDYITARSPLRNTYASADTLEGTRISVSVDATWIADEGKISSAADPLDDYRIRWVYVVGGVTHTHDSYFRVVRYQADHSVTAADMDEVMPGFVDYLPDYHQADQGRRLIDRAHRDVMWDLRATDVEAASVRDVDAINQAVILRVVANLAKHSVMAGRSSVESLQIAERDYSAFMDRVFRVVSRVNVDDGSGGASKGSPAPVWRR